jgi:ferric-dicitrate binding protein FerR (iron transport regulator)
MELRKDIDNLIHNYLEGIAEDAELETLINWLQGDKNNIRYFNQMCSIWENAGSSSLKEKDSREALEKLNHRLRNTDAEFHLSSDISPSQKKLSIGYQRAAAIALILLGLSFSIYFAFNRLKVHTSPTSSPGFYTVIAPKNQKSRLYLVDGTKVWLNCGTALKYKSDFNMDKREIYLDGEAYFEVAKNPLKPFMVHASSLVVKALGTSFNVKCYPEDKTVEATLIEGKLAVYNGNANDQKKHTVLLLPNEKATFNKMDSKLVVSQLGDSKNGDNKLRNTSDRSDAHSIESVISWKDQELVFENEPFDELAKRLERWYNVSIEIKDSSVLAGNRYTGKFLHNESLDVVLKIISRTTPIKYTVLHNKVTIDVKKNDSKKP